MLAIWTYLAIIDDIPGELYGDGLLYFFARSLIYIIAIIPSLLILCFDILISPIEIIIAIIYLIKRRRWVDEKNIKSIIKDDYSDSFYNIRNIIMYFLTKCCSRNNYRTRNLNNILCILWKEQIGD